MSNIHERIFLSQEDITKLKIDVIVNAANSALCGGGGVDGAIHQAAGPALLEECRQLGRCETGHSVITDAYNLPAAKVIHTVGPVWYGGHKREADLLASCYRSALKIANDHQLSSIAFPAISCGAYRFPVEQAAQIAVKECTAFLLSSKLPAQIHFCCFSTAILEAYEAAIKDQLPQ